MDSSLLLSTPPIVSWCVFVSHFVVPQACSLAGCKKKKKKKGLRGLLAGLEALSVSSSIASRYSLLPHSDRVETCVCLV